MTELNDNHLRPPDILDKPAAYCDNCEDELWNGDDVFFGYDKKPLVFCTRICVTMYYGITIGTLGDDAH